MKTDKRQIRPSTFVLLAIGVAIVLMLLPGGLELIVPFAAIPLFILWSRQGRIKPMTALDFFLIPLYLVLALLIMIALHLVAFESVPWAKIILVGLACDIVASLLGSIPVVGDVISGIINFFIPFIIIGLPEGPFIATAVAIISMLPGPTFGLITLMLVTFKLFAGAIL